MAPVEPHMNDLAREIRGLEESLPLPAVRRDPAALERLLAAEFVEHGSSGALFDRAATIKALERETHEREIALEDFHVRRLAAGVVLATYRAAGEGRSSRRCSIWIHRDGRWQLAFHQGTAIPASDQNASDSPRRAERP
jgi:hypothetical protein